MMDQEIKRTNYIYAPRSDIETLNYLREKLNRPLLAFEIKNKTLSHKEALETLKFIFDELNRKE